MIMKLEGDYAIDKVLWAHRIAGLAVMLGWLIYYYCTEGGLAAYNSVVRNFMPLATIWFTDYVVATTGVFHGNCGFTRWQSFPSHVRFGGWCFLLFLPLLKVALGD